MPKIEGISDDRVVDRRNDPNTQTIYIPVKGVKPEPGTSNALVVIANHDDHQCYSIDATIAVKMVIEAMTRASVATGKRFEDIPEELRMEVLVALMTKLTRDIKSGLDSDGMYLENIIGFEVRQ